ncbi:MAG TPA: CRISPR-associated protein Cas4 [Chloroflexota bacterium]|nr:CRISPR-associated protein Cas4 [Chloroflexota bacterium]
MTPAGLEEDLWFNVTDVRQFLYCPRLLHFRLSQPLRHRLSFKMEEGVRMHERAGELERRRSLRAYGLSDGTRRFGVELASARLGIRGKLDMLIERPFEAIPVEFKHAHAEAQTNHRYQLTLYALLAEEAQRRPVRRGFLFYLLDGVAEEVLLTEGMRRFVTRTLREMRAVAYGDGMPQGTRRLGRCWACEYLHFCNDRW